MGSATSEETVEQKEKEYREENDEKPTYVDPATLHVNDLLRHTDDVVNFDHDPKPVFVDIGEIVPGAYLVENLLTPDECKQFIEISEKMGYEPSPLRDLDTINSNNFKRDSSTSTIRNSLRVMLDIPDHIGRVLEERLLPHMPATVECNKYQWQVHRENPINKRWRFNRYDKGNYFKPHFDAGYVYKNFVDKTLFTFILYLNDGFEGGETIFFPGGRKRLYSKREPGLEYKVIPKAGMAICFFQDGELSPFHEGAMLLGDVPKYILRSDLRYTRND